MPVSMSATTMLLLPVVISQARVASISAPGVPTPDPGTDCPVFSSPQSSPNRGSSGTTFRGLRIQKFGSTYWKPGEDARLVWIWEYPSSAGALTRTVPSAPRYCVVSKLIPAPAILFSTAWSCWAGEPDTPSYRTIHCPVLAYASTPFHLIGE